MEAINRRHFLAGSVGVAGAVVLGACTVDDQKAGRPPSSNGRSDTATGAPPTPGNALRGAGGRGSHGRGDVSETGR